MPGPGATDRPSADSDPAAAALAALEAPGPHRLAALGALARDPVPDPRLARRLVSFSGTGTPREGAVAQAALRGMGRAALDALVPLLDAPEPALRAWALRAIPWRSGAASEAARQRLLDALSDPDPAPRRAALEALETGHPPAEAVAARLAGFLDDPDPESRAHARRALGAMGGPGAARLLDHARGARTPEERWDLAFALLGATPEDLRGHEPLIREWLADEASVSRMAGAALLARLGPASHAEAPRLLALLPAAPPTEQVQLLRALAAIAPDDPALHERLLEALRARDRVVAEEAVELVSRVVPREEPARRALAAALDGRAGAWATALLAQHGAPAIPTLLEVLASGTPTARRRALEALAQMGPAGAAAAPVVARVAATPGHPARTEAFTALAAFGPAGRAGLAPARAALAEDPAEVPPWALGRLLLGLGPEGRAALLGLLAAERPDVRARAVQAAASAPATDAEVLEALAARTHDADPAVRAATARALVEWVRTRPDATARVRPLLDALAADASPPVRAAAQAGGGPTASVPPR